ncbi:MAG: hypothetical protein RLZZ453_108 [Chlamydiota bacterium]
MFRFAIFATALSLNGFTADHSKTENCPDDKRHYRTTLRHIESGGIGYNDGYTTLEAFFAPDPTLWPVTPFLDLRGHVFNNAKWAANAGIGLRGLYKDRVFGINTYYDYRNTHRFHYNQIGVGLETLGKIVDFRINGYLPVGKKITKPYDPPLFAGFSGNHMLVSQKYEFAMKGADAEFGFHFGKSKLFDFYAAAGPYYFIGQIGSNTWGGKARIGGTYKNIISLELRDSYDRIFHNHVQGQISLNFPFGPKSKVKRKGSIDTCKLAGMLTSRMLQPVDRVEIVVVDKRRNNTTAINPVTGAPYFFVFVDNTSSSNGTYESPYSSLAQAQAHSAPNDILYVFPGDGTTAGMNAGITLQPNQKFWGSGVSYLIQTSVGTTSIPAQSSSAPTITNTDGNAITLANNNAISGFTIASANNDAIYGIDPQSLEISYCTIESTNTYAIEATCTSNSSISLTNNQFLNNVNGVLLTLNGTATLVCSNNTFQGQTSVSSIPLEISAESNILTAYIENNVFNDNTTGSIRLNLDGVLDATINVLNNSVTNNGTGAISTLGSSFVVVPSETTVNCSIALSGNTFSNNASHSVYLQTSGAFTTLGVTVSDNTMSNNGGAGLILDTPVDTLTLLASDNIISGCLDHGIALVSSTSTTTGTITINNNTIRELGNTSNGIAITQGFSTLDFTILNNEINQCEGSGILCFASEFTNMNMNITDNIISNCQNIGGNAASGISVDTYLNLTSTVANNTLSGNAIPDVAFGLFTSGNPNVCLTLTGNSSDTDPGYSLTNPGSGFFNLSPCNVDVANTGTIDRSGTITPIQACPGGGACP